MFFLVVLSLPTVGYFVLQQKSVQQYLVKKITGKITDFLGAPVSMSGAEINLLNTITFHNFCVQTPQLDTILFTPELEIKLNTFTISSKFLEFKKVTMTKPRLNFKVDSANNINFQFIISKLEAKDTSTSPNPLVVSIREIILKDADFKLQSYWNTPKPYGINFTNLWLNPLNIQVTNFRVEKGVSMNIRHLSAIDHSGFVIDNLSARFRINKENMIFNHIDLLTPKSRIDAHQVHLKFNSTKQFKPGIFNKKVKLDIDLRPSDISSDDISYFLPFLKDYHLSSQISGTFRGVLNDLKARNLNISYGKHTSINADVDINGLPDIASSFLHVNIKQLHTVPSDIESIRLPTSSKGRIVLPNNFNTISYLTYKGKFTGFFNDFVAYGTINTNLGKLESDLSLKPDTSDQFKFEGRLKANQFEIGQFIGKPDKFGRITLNAMVSGIAGSSKNARARLSGSISSFEVNNYNYQNIQVNGTFSNHTYDGSLSVLDPNLVMNFLGKVNLSGQSPVFNFKADVKKANLYPLRLDGKDTGSFVSFYATADFEGNNFDNLNGEIKLWNSTIRRAGKQIQMNDFLLFTKTLNETKTLILRSDLADAEIWGNYQFSELAGSFASLAHYYLPSLVTNTPSTTPGANNFKFEVDFKDTRDLANFFEDGLYISKDTKLSGEFNPSAKLFNFQIKVPLLQHKTKKWYDFYITGNAHGDIFSVSSGCNSLKISKQLEFKNLSLEADIKNDTIDSKMRWNNWDTVAYKGNLAFAAFVKPSGGDQIPMVNIRVKPSQFVLQDTTWSIKSGAVAIGPSGINIDRFLITHNNQAITIFGNILQKQNHTLSAEFKNVNLENLNTVVNTKTLSLNGIINGNLEVSNLDTNPLFRTHITLDSLSINGVRLGKTQVSAIYDNNGKEIKIDANSERGSLKTLDIKGTYGTETKKLNFNIGLNKLKLDIFSPYIANIFSNLNGVATGDINLGGLASAPELNGTVKIQKGVFRVNYLNTTYSFTNNVEIKKNKFLLKNIEVNDSRSNKAVVNGFIEYRNLKDIYTDINIKADNLECLNTTEKDNNLFYGQGFASGTVRIVTAPQKVNMEIDASTNENTVVSIPLSTKINQSNEGFIRFVNKQNVVKPFDQYEIDRMNESKQIAIPTNFNLDFYLNVTPEATVQIVFDQKIGDMITGAGSGDLNLKLEGGKFNMYGTYMIDRGEYLFTLQNVFNRKFIVDRGGTITWDGDPVDASVDIKAIYKLSASLFQLTRDEQYKKYIPVECRLFLTDKLLSPTIRYDINLPGADQQSQNELYQNITSDEEKSEQFLALLFGGNFMPSQNSGESSTSGLGINAARSTGLEFLSNQFSRMLSQISRDFDIGFNYKPGDEVTTGQAEMAFSTQILNDRVTINGNVDVGGEQVSTTNKTTNNIVGEGSVEVRITKNGKLKMKVFNRSNQNNFYKYMQSAPYTQGLGIFYHEEFNSFPELLKKYMQKITGRKEEPMPQVVNDTIYSNSDDE